MCMWFIFLGRWPLVENRRKFRYICIFDGGNCEFVISRFFKYIFSRKKFQKTKACENYSMSFLVRGVPKSSKSYAKNYVILCDVKRNQAIM